MPRIYNPTPAVGIFIPRQPSLFYVNRAPTTNDIYNFNLGDFWIHRLPNPNQPSNELWVLVSLAGNIATWIQLSLSATALQSLTGNSGGTVFPDASHNINVVGDGISTQTIGNIVPNQLLIKLDGITEHAIQIGGPSDTLNNVSGLGNAGQILTSNGPGMDPTWQNAPASGIMTIDGDVGSVTGSTVNFYASTGANTAGSSVTFQGSADTMRLYTTDASNNTVIGTNAGSAGAGTFNTGLGDHVLSSLSAPPFPTAHTCVGYQAGKSLTSGNFNTYIGYNAGVNDTTGVENVIIGSNAGGGIVANNTCIVIGANAGSVATGGVSNILIGHPGVAGDSFYTRIGNSQLKCFISGIDGVNVGSVAKVVTEASDQLGTATITGGTGITVTPGANTITIDATGAGAVTYSTGTWVPNLKFGGASTGITYTTQSARYTQIGDLVFVAINIVLTSKGTATGNASVDGFPFTSTLGIDLPLSISFVSMTVNYTWGWTSFNPSNTEVNLYQSGPGQGTLPLDDTDFANNSGITIQGFYFK